MDGKGQRVVLGVSGSVAAVKTPDIVRRLRDKGFEVSCVMTSGAVKFVSPLAISTFCGEAVHTDMWSDEAYRVPHLRLSSEASVMLIAPASAAILAKCAHGVSDDLVTLTYLSASVPVVMAPAMHPTMWEHPATRENVRILKERGVTFVGPYIGPLADHTIGEGRMSDPDEIVAAIEKILLGAKRS